MHSSLNVQHQLLTNFLPNNITKTGRANTQHKRTTTLKLGKITIYPHVVWPKFKLPTCGLKFDTLPT